MRGAAPAIGAPPKLGWACEPWNRWAAPGVLRRSHGYDQPHKVKYWCLGNEMDGPWQMGRLTAREYGRKARDIAQQARVIDPDVQLIACGSSNTILPTYLAWDREVLEECYDMVDGISLHNYFGNEPELAGGKSERFLAQNLDMERQILEITAVADYVQGLYRSPKKLWLSFDEWNVWYRARSAEHLDGKGAFAPKLLEEVYNLEDALLTGGFLNTLMRQSDRVRVACLAQIVNVIAPLVTNSKGIAAPVHLLPVPDGAQVRARPHARHPGGERDLPDPRRGPARRLRAQRGGARSSTSSPPTTRRRSESRCSRSIAISRTNASWRSPSKTSRLRACSPAETVTGPDLKAFNTFESPNKVVTDEARRGQGRREDVGEAAGAFVHRRPPGGLRHDDDRTRAGMH